MNIAALPRKIVRKLEEQPFGFFPFFLTLSAIIILRYAIDVTVAPFHNSWYFFIHQYFFFLLTYLIVLLVLYLATREPLERIASFVLAGFLIIITPPLIDEALSRGNGYLITYLFVEPTELGRRFLTFFGDGLTEGITYGVRTEIAIVIGASAYYVWLKTRRFSKTFFTGLALYVIMFALAALPILATFVGRGLTQEASPLRLTDVVAFSASPTPIFHFVPRYSLAFFDVKMTLVLLPLLLGAAALVFYLWRKNVFLALWNNARFPQLVYHGGLLGLGMLLALRFTDAWIPKDFFHTLAFLAVLVAVLCAWLASVCANDVFDTRIDKLTNPARPLITASIPRQEFLIVGAAFFTLSLVLPLLVYPVLSFYLLIYQALAWMYSAPPFRLKRFPGIATLVAAGASLLILFTGYALASPDHSLAGLPWQLPAFLFVAYTLVIPLKDLKDIAGDRRDSVYTLPVVLGEALAKHVLSSIVFLLFIASVFVLRIPDLFPLALLFGMAGFWLIEKSTEKHPRFNYRALLGWIVALITGYGLLLCLALF